MMFTQSFNIEIFPAYLNSIFYAHSPGGRTVSSPPKQHFYPAGATRCIDSHEIWHDRGARGSAWPCEISRESVLGVGTPPPQFENFHFLVVARRVNPLTDCYN